MPTTGGSGSDDNKGGSVNEEITGQWAVEPENYAVCGPTPPNTPANSPVRSHGSGFVEESTFTPTPKLISTSSARVFPSVLKNSALNSDDDFPFAPNNSAVDSYSDMDDFDSLSDGEKIALISYANRHHNKFRNKGGKRGHGGGGVKHLEKEKRDEKEDEKEAEQLGDSSGSDHSCGSSLETNSSAYQKALVEALNTNTSFEKNRSYDSLRPSSILEGLRWLGRDGHSMLQAGPVAVESSLNPRSRGISRPSAKVRAKARGNILLHADGGIDTESSMNQAGYESDVEDTGGPHRSIIKLPRVLLLTHNFIKSWSWNLGLVMFVASSLIQLLFLCLVVAIVSIHLGGCISSFSVNDAYGAPFTTDVSASVSDRDDTMSGRDVHGLAENATTTAAEVTVETTLCLFILFLASSSLVTNAMEITWILTKSNVVASLILAAPLKLALSDDATLLGRELNQSTSDSRPAAAVGTDEVKEQESQIYQEEQGFKRREEGPNDGEEEVLQIEPVDAEILSREHPMSPLVLVNTRDQFLSSLWQEVLSTFLILLYDIFLAPIKTVILATIDFCQRHRNLFNLICSLLLLGLTRDLTAHEDICPSSQGTTDTDTRICVGVGTNAVEKEGTCPNPVQDLEEKLLPLLPLRKGRRGVAPIERSVNQMAAAAATFTIVLFQRVCQIAAKFASWLPYARLLPPPLSTWISCMPETPGKRDDSISGRSILQTLYAMGPGELRQWVFLITYDPIFYLSMCVLLSAFTTSLLRRIILIHRLQHK